MSAGDGAGPADSSSTKESPAEVPRFRCKLGAAPGAARGSVPHGTPRIHPSHPGRQDTAAVCWVGGFLLWKIP